MDKVKSEETRTWRVYWNGNHPFLVDAPLWLVASLFPGCSVEPVSESEVRKIERKAYEADLALRKFKRAKR